MTDDSHRIAESRAGRTLVLSALLVCATSGCGGNSTTAADAGEGPAEAPEVDDGDADLPLDDSSPDRGDWTPPDYGAPAPESCGDGILDPGEECDDGNRMNDDGCDWTCRLGDGERLEATPDPAAGHLETTAEATLVDMGAGSAMAPFVPQSARIPVQWSGSEYALVWAHGDPADPTRDRRLATFRRFDRTGAAVGGWWSYEYGYRWTAFDLAWIGDSYGLGVVNEDDDIVYFVVLDPNGKPRSDPSPIGSTPVFNAAMRLVADPPGFACEWYGLTLARLDRSGRHRDGSPVLADGLTTHATGLATSGGSYLLTWPGDGDDRPVRYAMLDSDLGVLVGPRTLGPFHSLPPMAVDADGILAVAWLVPGPDPDGTGGPVQVAVARFDPSGRLLGPPTVEPSVSGLLSSPAGAATTAGVGSIATAYLAPDVDGVGMHLRLARFDLFGTFIEQVELLDSSSDSPRRLVGGLGVACDGFGFGVFARPLGAPSDFAPVFFRWRLMR